MQVDADRPQRFCVAGEFLIAVPGDEVRADRVHRQAMATEHCRQVVPRALRRANQQVLGADLLSVQVAGRLPGPAPPRPWRLW